MPSRAMGRRVMILPIGSSHRINDGGLKPSHDRVHLFWYRICGRDAEE